MRKTRSLVWFAVLVGVGCSFPVLLPQPTQTPVITPSSTPTLTPTNSPTPTNTPTPEPMFQIEAGDLALFNGDWELAISTYQTTLEQATSENQITSAILGLGKTYYFSKQYEAAEVMLGQLIDDYPLSTQRIPAYFFLGKVDFALQKYDQAVNAYMGYLHLRPGLIDSWVYEWIGDAYFSEQIYMPAIDAYQSAIGASAGADDFHLEVKIAQSYSLLDEHQTAALIYEDILTRTSDDYFNATLELLTGREYLELNQIEEANEHFLIAVLQYPKTYDSYTALMHLIQSGYPVDGLISGVVYYNAGKYLDAISAVNDYLNSAPDDHPGSPHYYKALALRAIGDYDAAIAEFDVLIDTHPADFLWVEAWDEKIYTQWAYQDQYTEAIQTSLDFIERNPDHPRVSDIVFNAGRIAERAGQLDTAVDLWIRVDRDYPGSEMANQSLFLAGITRFRQKQNDQALMTFEQFRSSVSSPGELAKAFVWIGKCLDALGDKEKANQSWKSAAETDPTGYYSERAQDLYNHLQVFPPPAQVDFTIDLEQPRMEAESWMVSTFTLGPDVDLQSIEPLMVDKKYWVGTELWSLGQYEPAQQIFEKLLDDYRDDPESTYRIANYLVELGLYRSAINASRRILTLAGLDDAQTIEAPVYFNFLRFGTYYKDLIISAADAYDISPLLLFSVTRQESLFEGFIRSSAGARGVMQIMPATGMGIAEQAGWPPDYTSDDLYRPKVNFTYGAQYLHNQLDYFDGDIYAALAAYNAGPGNAAIWMELAPDDPDLFLEVIRFNETQQYIKRIYENYSFYRKLYAGAR